MLQVNLLKQKKFNTPKTTKSLHQHISFSVNFSILSACSLLPHAQVCDLAQHLHTPPAACISTLLELERTNHTNTTLYNVCDFEHTFCVIVDVVKLLYKSTCM